MTVKLEINAEKVKELKKISGYCIDNGLGTEKNAVAELLEQIFDNAVETGNEAESIQDIIASCGAGGGE